MKRSLPVLAILLALVPAKGLGQGSCVPTATRLCLGGDRFQAEVSWAVPELGTGAGQAVPLTADTGAFWFFSSSNLELTVKVLDGRAVNHHFWVFYGGLSNVEYTLTVTDLQTGARKAYQNPAGRFASVADVSPFGAEAPSLAASPARSAAQAATASPELPLPLGAEFQVDAGSGGIDDHYSTIAALPLPSGDTWVLWHETGLPQDEGGGIFSAVFDRSWALQGDISRVNSDTAGFQYDPAVAASYDGLKMAAVWARAAGPVSPPPQGGDGAGLFARRFTSAGCALDAGQLCLGGRFRVAVTFTDPRTGVPAAGQALPLTGDTGAFWFFDAGNLELVVKMLDGRPVNDHFWWFYSGLSDLDYTIAVTDTATGGQRTYPNARHHLASGADLTTFPIPVSAH